MRSMEGEEKEDGGRVKRNGREIKRKEYNNKEVKREQKGIIERGEKERIERWLD